MSAEAHNCDEQGREMCCYCWRAPAMWKRTYDSIPGEDHICQVCKDYVHDIDSRDQELLPI